MSAVVSRHSQQQERQKQQQAIHEAHWRCTKALQTSWKLLRTAQKDFRLLHLELGDLVLLLALYTSASNSLLCRCGATMDCVMAFLAPA